MNLTEDGTAHEYNNAYPYSLAKKQVFGSAQQADEIRNDEAM
jgi:hypothetical protein